MSIWHAFFDSQPHPLKTSDDKCISHIFRIKIRGAYVKMATIIFVKFPAEKIPQLFLLISDHTNGKTQITRNMEQNIT